MSRKSWRGMLKMVISGMRRLKNESRRSLRQRWMQIDVRRQRQMGGRKKGEDWTVARWNFAPKTSDSLWEEYLCDWCVRLFGCALDRTVNLTLT